MSLIAWLQRLWQRGRQPYQPNPDLFPLLDVPKTARELRLEDDGHRRGGLNEPAGEAVVFDEVEIRIVTLINDQKARAFDEAASHLRAVRERASALQLDALI